jgi:hypothetical protein
MVARTRALVIGLIVVTAAVCGIWLNRVLRTKREQQFTSQCANHAIQHKFTFIKLLSEKQEYQFSAETNARLALAPITQPVKTPERDWLNSFWSACPESYERDKSIGYLFLADSLAVNEDMKDPAVILICPAENHQGSSEHCHAVMTSGLECLTNNLEALELLREHVKKATDGTIKYSANAQAVMAHEIQEREKFERRRKR